MILQSGGPPDTSAYYHIAYVWVAAVYVGYSLLLWIRGRRVRQRLDHATRGDVRAARDA